MVTIEPAARGLPHTHFEPAGVHYGVTLTAFTILAIVALILAILSIVKPQWPLLAVAVILIAVALLISGKV